MQYVVWCAQNEGRTRETTPTPNCVVLPWFGRMTWNTHRPDVGESSQATASLRREVVRAVATLPSCGNVRERSNGSRGCAGPPCPPRHRAKLRVSVQDHAHTKNKSKVLRHCAAENGASVHQSVRVYVPANTHRFAQKLADVAIYVLMELRWRSAAGERGETRHFPCSKRMPGGPKVYLGRACVASGWYAHGQVLPPCKVLDGTGAEGGELAPERLISAVALGFVASDEGGGSKPYFVALHSPAPLMHW